MAATATISWPAPTGGSINQQIQYRAVGNATWTVYATVGPAVTSSAISLPNPGNYEWQIVNICSNGVTTPSPRTIFYVCSCPSGYTKDATNGNCYKASVINPTTAYSNYCLAPAQLIDYTSEFTRIYNPGFSNATIAEVVASRPQDVFAEYSNAGQWSSTAADNGPMNRVAVWIDSNCDGVKDPVLYGTQTTLSYAYNNTGVSRRVYVGIGADNLFTLKVNGVVIAKADEVLAPNGSSNSLYFFKLWHIFPVTITTGWNYFNAIGTGGGGPLDSIGMTIYDLQDPAVFVGPHTQIDKGITFYDIGLNILWSTKQLIGQHIDIATCTDGYSLDTSGGPGNYKCTRTETVSCG